MKTLTGSFEYPEGFQPITPQRVFDASWQAFVVENRPLAMHRGVCTYLTPDGCKCAIGLCIPDGHPAQNMSVVVRHVRRMYPEMFGDSDPDVLESLQCMLHDWFAGIPLFKRFHQDRANIEQIYRQVAIRYNLTVSEPSLPL